MKSKHKLVLIVDDEESVGCMLKRYLASSDYDAEWVSNGDAALSFINENPPDVVLLDLSINNKDGISVLQDIRKIDTSAVIIMISGYGTTEKAVEAARYGAYTWLAKPFSQDQILNAIKEALTEQHDLKDSLPDAKDTAASLIAFIGESQITQDIQDMIERIAPTNAAVIITGERGTGKSRLAHTIHMNSRRTGSHFMSVHCVSIPNNMMDYELFGQSAISTAGRNNVAGKFQLANNGTLYFKDIDCLSLSAQVKVLHALETGEITKIAEDGTVGQKVDVRPIASTCNDQQLLIQRSILREDLNHYLSVVKIHIPPLRERPSDIIPLLKYFLRELCDQFHLEPRRLNSDIERALLSYTWPGNVDELLYFARNVILNFEDETIRPKHLEQVLIEPLTVNDFLQYQSFEIAKQNYEKRYLIQALSSHHWNIAKTAKSIDISKALLEQKMKIYGLDA
jgi:two-component system response regulator AtoC